MNTIRDVSTTCVEFGKKSNNFHPTIAEVIWLAQKQGRNVKICDGQPRKTTRRRHVKRTENVSSRYEFPYRFTETIDRRTCR